MKKHKTIILLTMTILGTGAFSASAQSINLWRGNETGADWSDTYKWKLKHVPSGSEAVHFRQQSSVISVNSTIELGNGMHLYGQELLLEGNGNINLRSAVPHQRSISIPASSSGYANLTLADNVSVNAQLSLSAKSYGTSASKGSVTLKDRSTITGEVSIGNDGSGSGQIILRDQSTYRITRLKLDTLASKGGSSEIHILGGTARIDAGDDPFEAFLVDSSRKIIIGDNGTLHIESNMPVGLKNEYINKLLAQQQIISAHGCQLGSPVIRNNMVIIKAERIDTSAQFAAALASAKTKPVEEKTAFSPPPPSAAPTSPVSPTPKITKAESPPRMGYVVFFSPILLLLLRPARPKALATQQRAEHTSSQPRETEDTETSLVQNKAA